MSFSPVIFPRSLHVSTLDLIIKNDNSKNNSRKYMY